MWRSLFSSFPVFKRVKETGKEVAQNLCSFVSILFFVVVLFSLWLFSYSGHDGVLMQLTALLLLLLLFHLFSIAEGVKPSFVSSFPSFFFTRQRKHNFVLSFFSSPFDENACRRGEKRKVKLERRCFFRSCSWWIIDAARCSILTMTMAAMVWKKKDVDKHHCLFHRIDFFFPSRRAFTYGWFSSRLVCVDGVSPWMRPLFPFFCHTKEQKKQRFFFLHF